MSINSASIPALRVARSVKRRRAEGGEVDSEGLAPENYQQLGTVGRGVLNVAKRALWDLPKEAVEHALANPQPGLRREDFTDVPVDTSPDPRSALGGVGVKVPRVGWQPVDPMVGSSLEAGANIMAGTALSAPAVRAGEVVAGAGPISKGGAETVHKIAVMHLPTGKVYADRGVIHSDLIDRAAHDLGRPLSEMNGEFTSGYTTNFGRYILRDEAGRLLDAGGPLYSEYVPDLMIPEKGKTLGAGVAGIPAAGIAAAGGEDERARGGRVAIRVARRIKKRRAEGGEVYDPLSGIRIGGRSSEEPAPDPQGPLSKTLSRLTGTQFGEPRHQLWPEKMVRSGATLAGDVLSGQQAVLPPGLRREDYTDAPAPSGPTQDSTWLGRATGLPPVQAQPNDPMMERAQDMAGMAGGQTLLTGAAERVPVAQRALVAAADSQATGAPLAALEHAPKFYSGLEHAVEAIPQPTMTGQQWLGTLNNRGIKAEEMQWSGLGQYLGAKADQPVTKAEVAQHLGSNKLELGETHLGEMKFDKSSPYALPEVVKAARQAGDHPGDLELVLANDGDAYHALTKKFPDLIENEDWASVVSNSVFGGDTMPKGATKYHDYQLPGGEGYREKLLTLPSKPADMSRNAAGLVDNPVSPDYRSSHWDEPNVLVHRRTNEREIAHPLSPEEMQAVEIRKAAQSDLDKLRADQNEVARKIQVRATPFEEGRKREIMADLKAGKITRREALAKVDEYVPNLDLKPLQDRLQALRAQEDQLRASLPPEPKNSRRALHIEEIQSDWHQVGRKQGYRAEQEAKLADLVKKRDVLSAEVKPGPYTPEQGRQIQELNNIHDQIRELSSADPGVPDAPFKKNWHELALKDAIREAAEKGLDRISWTPGEAQAARYDLSKSISEVTYHPRTKSLVARDLRGEKVLEKTVEPDKIADHIGKDAAKNLLDSPATSGPGRHKISGDGLKVGGEGMRGFYDKIIPDALNKIGKPHGVKVQMGAPASAPKVETLQNGAGEKLLGIEGSDAGPFRNMAELNKWWKKNGDVPVHYMDIPQSLKEQALKKGFSLFEDSAATGAPVAALEHATQTPEFKRWFGNSKAVDAEGNPDRFYHGTTSDFDTFGPIGGGNQYGDGYYFTKSPESASNYATGDVNRISPEGNAHPNVMPVYLKYEKPYDRRGPVSPADLRKLEAAANELEPGHWKRGELARQFGRVYPANGDNVVYQLGPRASQIIRDAGFDAFVAPDMTVVFDPTQIKSATGNSGSFSSKNPSALLEDAAVGVPLTGSENEDQDAAALDAAIALGQKSKPIKKKSAIQSPERNRGGSVNPAMNVARNIKRAKGGKVHVGPIVGNTGGRADKVPMEVPDGAYVVPADICSGLGEGNSGAGMLKLGQMFPESKPSLMRGLPGHKVKILAADGEYVVSPKSILKRWGDLDFGHKSLDAWVLHEREQLIDTLKKLPGPAQD